MKSRTAHEIYYNFFVIYVNYKTVKKIGKIKHKYTVAQSQKLYNLKGKYNFYPEKHKKNIT